MVSTTSWSFFIAALLSPTQLILIKGTKLTVAQRYFLSEASQWCQPFSFIYKIQGLFSNQHKLFLIFMEDSLNQWWIINILINKREIIFMDFRRLECFVFISLWKKACCKGKIYLHRNLIKIFDQRYCNKTKPRNVSCLTILWWHQMMLFFQTLKNKCNMKKLMNHKYINLAFFRV